MVKGPECHARGFEPDPALPMLHLLVLMWLPVRGSCLWASLLFCLQPWGDLGLIGKVVTHSPGDGGREKGSAIRAEALLREGHWKEPLRGNSDLFKGIVQLPGGATWGLGCPHTHLGVFDAGMP